MVAEVHQMNYLVFGGSGLLGREFAKFDVGIPHKAHVFSRDELDITNTQAVISVVERIRPDMIINCAAWTDIDKGESFPKQMFKINTQAVCALTQLLEKYPVKFFQLSTDYVFDGVARDGHSIGDLPNPVNKYGLSKLEAERCTLHFLPHTGYVIRTSWLYGHGGSTFPNKILNTWRTAGKVVVLGTSFGQPTWTKTLSRRILSLAISEAPPGIYHITGKGSASRFSYAQELFRSLHLPVHDIEQGHSAVSGAQRPKSTILIPTDLSEFCIEEMPAWEDDLDRAVKDGVFNGF